LDRFLPEQRRKGLLAGLIIAALGYAVFRSVLWPVQVLGDSMCPTYYNGTRHYVNKLAYWAQKPQRGDVVTLNIRQREMFIKRIVGLPGERVEFSEGRILINGQLLQENYTGTVIPWKMESIELGPDHYFVIGDNRAESVHGVVPMSRIIGKVLF
jgi:signal peptidase I